jgi:non-ribosomal peptide synthetase component F
MPQTAPAQRRLWFLHRLAADRAGYVHADHVAWLERRRAGYGPSDVDWWAERLAGTSGVLDLPRDRPRPPVQTHDSAEAGVRVPDPAAALVHRFAADLGVPPAVPVLAAFSVLLGRLTGQHDLVVGLLAARRRYPDAAGTVGLFTDLLPARMTVADGVDFAGHVRAVDGIVTSALDHRDAPFDRIVDRMRLPRDLSRAPLVQVSFEMGFEVGLEMGLEVGSGAARLELPRLAATRLDGAVPGSPFDLTLRVADHAGGPTLTATYNPSLYRSDRIDAMLASLVTLLAGLAGDPGRPVMAATARPPGTSPLPDPVAPMATGTGPFSGPGGVVERVRRWAADQPDRTAVRSPDGTLTYHELDRLRAAVDAAVRGAGVHPGEAVAILASRDETPPHPSRPSRRCRADLSIPEESRQ